MKYENTIDWNCMVRMMGQRIFMVKQGFKNRLSMAYKINSEDINQKNHIFEQNLEMSMSYFEPRVALFEQLKRKKNIGSNTAIQIQIPCLDSIQSLEQLCPKKENIESVLENHAQTIFYTLDTYRDIIHGKVDTILKGTENDPIGRAQFDNFISRISQTYEEANLNIKSPKEK